MEDLRRRAREGLAAGRSAPAPARTSAPWASTRRGSTGRSSASRRPGRGRCRATSTTARWPSTRGGRHGGGRRGAAFNTIAVSDNQSQGTPGMRASLDLARGHRRLDRADGPRARLRRARVPRGLRQDGARRADGARARRQAGGRALQRPDARRALARPTRDDPGRVGGGRGVRARRARRAPSSTSSSGTPARARARAPGTSRRTRWPSRSSAWASRSVGDGLIPADDRRREGRRGGARRRASRPRSRAAGRRRARSSTGARC